MGGSQRLNDALKVMEYLEDDEITMKKRALIAISTSNIVNNGLQGENANQLTNEEELKAKEEVENAMKKAALRIAQK